jgi:hypothetical protein
MRLPSLFALRPPLRGCVCQQRLYTSPAQLYDEQVKSGRLRNDDFQRSVVAKLDGLHNQLATYDPPDIPKVIEYSSWLDRLRGKPAHQEVPPIPDHGQSLPYGRATQAETCW